MYKMPAQTSCFINHTREIQKEKTRTTVQEITSLWHWKSRLLAEIQFSDSIFSSVCVGGHGETNLNDLPTKQVRCALYFLSLHMHAWPTSIKSRPRQQIMIKTSLQHKVQIYSYFPCSCLNMSVFTSFHWHICLLFVTQALKEAPML